MGIDFLAAEEAARQVRANLELNLASYGPNHVGGANSVSIVNQAISDLSAAAIAAGVPRARLVIPDKYVLRVDSNILMKPRVALVSQGARLVAGADFTNAGLIRFAPTQTAAVGVGTASMDTAAPRVLTSVASPTSYYPEMVISGTGIAANTKVVAVDVENSVVVIDTDVTSTGTGRTITRAATYYNTYTGCGLFGLELDPNGFDTKSILYARWLNDFSMDGMRVQHNLPLAHPNWAVNIGGRNVDLGSGEIIGGHWATSDGLHIAHGQNIRGGRWYIESGDDMLAFGHDDLASFTGSLYDEPDPIRNVVIDKITGRSEMAAAVKVYRQVTQTGRDYEITNVSVDQVEARASITDRNGVQTSVGIGIQDLNDGAAGSNIIKHIRVGDFNIEAGSATNTAAVAAICRLAIVRSADDVWIGPGRGSVETVAAPSVGFDGVIATKSADLTITGFNFTQNKRHAIRATTCPRLKITGCRTTANKAQSSLYPIRLEDCVDAEILGNHFTVITGQPAIRCDEGTTSTLLVDANTVRSIDNDATGMLLHVTAAAITSLRLGRNQVDGQTTDSPSELRTILGEPAGIVTPTTFAASSTPTLVAQRVLANAFRVERATRFNAIAFYVKSGAAATNDDPVHVGIYDKALSRLVTSGAVSGKLNSSGRQTVTIANTKLQPGLYYVALLCPTVGGTGAQLVGASAGDLGNLQVVGTGAPDIPACQMLSQSSLPSTITPAFNTVSTVQLAAMEG